MNILTLPSKVFQRIKENHAREKALVKEALRELGMTQFCKHHAERILAVMTLIQYCVVVMIRLLACGMTISGLIFFLVMPHWKSGLAFTVSLFTLGVAWIFSISIFQKREVV